MIVISSGAGFLISNRVAGPYAPDDVSDVVVCYGLDHCCIDRDGVDPCACLTRECDADFFLRDNVILSLMLWRGCAEYVVMLIHASPAAVRGKGDCGFGDNPAPAVPACSRILNPCCWSRQIFDHRVTPMTERGDPVLPRWAGLEVLGVYGSGDDRKGNHGCVNVQIERYGARRESADLFRSEVEGILDGGQTRDVIRVDVMLWLRHSGAPGLLEVENGWAHNVAVCPGALCDVAGIWGLQLGRHLGVNDVQAHRQRSAGFRRFGRNRAPLHPELSLNLRPLPVIGC